MLDDKPQPEGDGQNLILDGIGGALLSAFPELEERIRSAFGSYYDLEKGTPEETPGPYLIFEDVVQKLVVSRGKKTRKRTRAPFSAHRMA